MFETAVLSYGSPTKRVWATLAGFTGQLILIGVALLAPLMWPQMIPRVAWVMSIAPPGAPPPPPPPGPQVTPHRTKTFTQIPDGILRAPAFTPPKAIDIIDDEPPISGGGGPNGGVPGGIRDGVPGSLVTEVMERSRVTPLPPTPVVREPKAPTPPPPPAKPPRISTLQMATPIHKVDPIYPPLARQARISGTVELVGVLGIDGRIHELRVVRGHALLIEAAMAAVKQWIFAPTILNGQPVEVQAPIQVNFILNR